ncbi:TPA: glycosyltransferase [Vibrio cholerae]|uniref:glycosyltransferase n=1 Tax=Vibrio cholerae TaxID=666 RepID=UPI0011D357ED|nr:glycosyltransferase [Vibrio cholerae]MCX9483572.1 glycosyltransferase [Vibrio cholerae]TXZ27576.1 glycosyltransferase [Vibrio cholerae]BCN21680.1 putative glycosyltransferase [Vibrio cholerae]GIA16458.1 Glycosyl transferases group 1 family protein [Vibrio cholerae]
MNIIFNCSVNIVGGAVQNAANFIRYAALSNEHQYMFIVSPAVNDVLEKWIIQPSNLHVVESPARSQKSRAKILSLEKEFKPDVVYTMAGPTYVNFKAQHVMGVSDPYITHADVMSLFLNRSQYQAWSFGLKEFIKGWYARFSADYFLFQTETSRDGFCRRYRWDINKTALLQNALGESFFSQSSSVDISTGVVRKIFVPSAYYSHKNLEIIFDICKLLVLSNVNKKFQFITSVPQDSVFSKNISELGLEGNIHNIGPYKYNDAHRLYSEADAVFIPSVLETFSTSYLEAIAMSKPLIVADRPFSREVCGKYAHYYSPVSPTDALNTLNVAVCSEVDLVERQRIISRYGSQEERFVKAISILEKFHDKVK